MPYLDDRRELVRLEQKSRKGTRPAVCRAELGEINSACVSCKCMEGIVSNLIQ